MQKLAGPADLESLLEERIEEINRIQIAMCRVRLLDVKISEIRDNIKIAALKVIVSGTSAGILGIILFDECGMLRSLITSVIPALA